MKPQNHAHPGTNSAPPSQAPAPNGPAKPPKPRPSNLLPAIESRNQLSLTDTHPRSSTKHDLPRSCRAREQDEQRAIDREPRTGAPHTAPLGPRTPTEPTHHRPQEHQNGSSILLQHTLQPHPGRVQHALQPPRAQQHPNAVQRPTRTRAHRTQPQRPRHGRAAQQASLGAHIPREQQHRPRGGGYAGSATGSM